MKNLRHTIQEQAAKLGRASSKLGAKEFNRLAKEVVLKEFSEAAINFGGKGIAAGGAGGLATMLGVGAYQIDRMPEGPQKDAAWAKFRDQLASSAAMMGVMVAGASVANKAATSPGLSPRDIRSTLKRMVTPGGKEAVASRATAPSPAEQFQIGAPVTVKRSGGAIENNWKVKNIDTVQGTVTVETTGGLRKTVKADDLLALNPQMKAEAMGEYAIPLNPIENFKVDTPVTVRRTNGVTEKNWSVKRIDRGQGTITVQNPEGLSKTLRADVLLELNPHLLQPMMLRSPALRSAMKPLNSTTLSPRKGAKILRRAILPEEAAAPGITPKVLKEMGVGPVRSVTVDNATYHLSQVFSLGGGRTGAVAYIETPSGIRAHVVYRSNSQATWRVAQSSIRNRHFGKGIAESDTQLPLVLSQDLHQASKRPIDLPDAPIDMGGSTNPGAFLLYALSEDGLGSTVAHTPNGGYASRAYMESMAESATPLARIGRTLETPGGKEVPLPADIKLPPAEKLPNFDQPGSSFEYENGRYAQINGGDGYLKGTLYDSHDGSVRYLLIEDRQGRVSVAGVELNDSPLTSFGVRKHYLDLEGLDHPLMEYASQVPVDFGGNQSNSYMSNWNYVRELPLIQHYYRHKGIPLPAAIGH